jgi:hypothetical protein
MVYYYVCRYINKYASEIYYVFKTLISHPSTRKTEYNILSIGCGDCADLFGINQFLQDNNRNPSVSYTGIDLNTRWRPIHDQIRAIFPTINFHFEYRDAFEYISSLEILPYNIVILEYVLNEVKKYTPEIIDAFIDCLTHGVVDRLPSDSFVVINDINHNMVRNSYLRFKRKAEENNTTQEIYLRFRNPATHPYGGRILQRDALIFNTIQDTRFREKSPCSSGIYILFKQ